MVNKTQQPTFSKKIIFQVMTDTVTTKRKLLISLALKRVKPGSGSRINFLNQRTWKRPVTNLNNILQQTFFVVVGGIATRLYLPERMSDDLGILILASDAATAKQELEQDWRSHEVSTFYGREEK
ncbi:MAG: hypothetical protein SAL07_04555 [Oscillatoria sp. PMC 1051.18]|nr:hypothetical protein [Oscillatoria sp. PMC 1051.18]